MKKLLRILRKTTSALHVKCYCFTEIAAFLFLKLIQIDNISSEKSQPDKKNPEGLAAVSGGVNIQTFKLNLINKPLEGFLQQLEGH